MLRLGSEREELGIVADQHGCPTSAAELARGVYAVLDDGLNDKHWGVYHFCQPEPTTWVAFAKEAFEIAAGQGMDIKIQNVKAITTDEYPTPAKRPANSVMDCSRFSYIGETGGDSGCFSQLQQALPPVAIHLIANKYTLAQR